VALLCLIAGLTAFNLITRPLRRLTETVSRFDIDGTPQPLPLRQQLWIKALTRMRSPCLMAPSAKCKNASVSSGAH
jgi:hypothetical protein